MWQGSTASAGQSLLWPRDGVVGPNGYEEASDAIPTLIVQATCELARALLLSDRTADSDLETQKIKRIKAGSVELEFGQAVAKPIPDAVQMMVQPYIVSKRGTASGAVSVLRG